MIFNGAQWTFYITNFAINVDNIRKIKPIKGNYQSEPIKLVLIILILVCQSSFYPLVMKKRNKK